MDLNSIPLHLVASTGNLIELFFGVVLVNFIGDARAYGAEYVNEDAVIDGDLITARTGGHCHLLARHIIDQRKTRI